MKKLLPEKTKKRMNVLVAFLILLNFWWLLLIALIKDSEEWERNYLLFAAFFLALGIASLAGWFLIPTNLIWWTRAIGAYLTYYEIGIIFVIIEFLFFKEGFYTNFLK